MENVDVQQIVNQVVADSKPIKGEKIYKLREDHMKQLFELADKLSKKRPRVKREWTDEEKAINKQRMDDLREKRKYRVRQREQERDKADLIFS